MSEDESATSAAPVTLTVTPGGTYVLSGDVEFREPAGRTVRPGGDLALCGCGRSAATPYCDGGERCGGGTDGAAR